MWVRVTVSDEVRRLDWGCHLASSFPHAELHPLQNFIPCTCHANANLSREDVSIRHGGGGVTSSLCLPSARQSLTGLRIFASLFLSAQSLLHQHATPFWIHPLCRLHTYLDLESRVLAAEYVEGIPPVTWASLFAPRPPRTTDEIPQSKPSRSHPV